MEAVILCGGLGTRLRSVLPDRPKCLAPVNGKTYLDHITSFLERQGIERIVFATGYLSGQVREWLSGVKGSWEGVISEEPERLGTGGALRLASTKIKSPDFFALNGDTFLDMDYKAFMDFHLSSPTDITLAATHVTDAERFGCLEMEGDAVVRFREKGAAQSGLVNAGVYAVRRNFIAAYPHTCFSLEHDVLSDSKKCFRGYRVEGGFIDIGTPASFEKCGEHLNV